MFASIDALFRRLQEAWIVYERYLTLWAFAFGFIIDNLTLRRVDLLAENLVLLFYVAVAGGMIVIQNTWPNTKFIGVEASKISAFVMQVAFGALFSAFVVFYVRSASFFTSWIFLFFLALFFVGNEFFRARYQHFVFQMNVFFIAVFSYAIFAVPLILGKIGGGIFVISGAISVAVIWLFGRALEKGSPHLAERRSALAISIVSIFTLFNVFYFANIIPPIPLALKESGIYHRIERINGDYRAQFEMPPWYRFFDDTSSTFHWTPGSPVYAYSAVFTPARIQTDIAHRWSYFDEGKDEWVVETTIRFPIGGGREQGYRGYSIKGNIKPGKWRVDVQTPRGQILGRMTFRVVEADFSPRLETAFR